MDEWTTEFKGISISYSDKWVKIKTNKSLLDYLNQPDNGSLVLSDYLHKTYKEKLGKELKITRESLSVEILVHAYLDVFSKNIEKIADFLPIQAKKTLKDAVQSIEGHTAVIDCGEIDEDPNRHVFDSLAPHCNMLYLFLGKRC